MISVVITASDDAAALARLLTQLVPAAAEGLVRQVLIRGAAGASRELAEDAGATIMAPDDTVLALARGDWIAGLPLGADLSSGWMETVAAYLAAEPEKPARLTTRGGIPGLSGKAEGWLVPRRLVPAAGAREQDLQRLARRSGRRVRILRRG